MSFTLASAISNFRQIADDLATPYLWSDAELTIYANEAQTEAARRARLLRDSTTTAIVQYSLAQGAQFITLDPRIIYIKQLFIASKQLPIVRKHRVDLDLLFPGWDSATQPLNLGDINHYCTDKDTGVIWFDSPSPAADTVNLTTIREPLTPMQLFQLILTTTGTTTNTATQTAVDGELKSRYQYGIVQWMLFRAYGKQDSETNDARKSADGLTNFELEFGKKVSAQDEMYTEEQYGYDYYDGSY